MRSLLKPKTTGAETLELCSSSIRDEEIKQGLQKSIPLVTQAELLYTSLGAESRLYSCCVVSNPDLTYDLAKHVYEQTFVRSTKTRNIYANLKKGCSNDICPLCGQGTVSQLDHYLPIANFPIFGLSPINLVPACSDCNKKKLTHTPDEAGKQTLHPYFDNIDQDRWLFGAVVEEKPATVVFSIKAPSNWNDVKRARVATHFHIYKLDTLFAIHAAVEINNIRFELQNMAIGQDFPSQISEHLHECARSRAAVYQNSWQRATYEALAMSTWFCSGGFKLN